MNSWFGPNYLCQSLRSSLKKQVCLKLMEGNLSQRRGTRRPASQQGKQLWNITEAQTTAHGSNLHSLTVQPRTLGLLIRPVRSAFEKTNRSELIGLIIQKQHDGLRYDKVQQLCKGAGSLHSVANLVFIWGEIISDSQLNLILQMKPILISDLLEKRSMIFYLFLYFLWKF